MFPIHRHSQLASPAPSESICRNGKKADIPSVHVGGRALQGFLFQDSRNIPESEPQLYRFISGNIAGNAMEIEETAT